MERQINKLVQEHQEERRKRWKNDWSSYCKETHPPREFHVFGDDVERLLKYMKSIHYSQDVINNYRRYLNRFDAYCFRKQITEFNIEKAESFINEEISSGQQVHVRNVITRFQHFLKTGKITTKRVCKYKAKLLSPQLEKLLTSYKIYNQKKGNHPLTVSKKEKLAREFLRRCNCTDICEINSEKIATAVVNTINKDEWCYARLFFRYCLEEKKISFEYGALIPKERRIQKLPSTYTTEEISKIEFSVDRTTNIGKRDYALLLLATRLGLRSSDIVDLRIKDIDFEKKIIKRIQLKTGNELELALVPDVEEALSEYLVSARPKSKNNTHVFLRNYAPYRPFSTAVLRTGVVKKYILQAEIVITEKKHGPHALRASVATAMVNDDVPFEAVSKVLGHNTKDTIQRYARLDLERLRNCAIEVAPASGKFQIWLNGGQNG